MAKEELMQLMARVRASISSLELRATDERGVMRALAHLWSAHDELEMIARDRAAAQAS